MDRASRENSVVKLFVVVAVHLQYSLISLQNRLFSVVTNGYETYVAMNIEISVVICCLTYDSRKRGTSNIKYQFL